LAFWVVICSAEKSKISSLFTQRERWDTRYDQGRGNFTSIVLG
jgi:hypothetical protein